MYHHLFQQHNLHHYDMKTESKALQVTSHIYTNFKMTIVISY